MTNVGGLEGSEPPTLFNFAVRNKSQNICIMELLDLIFKKRIHEDYGDDRKKILPWILALSGMTVAAGMVASSKETVWTEAVVDLMPYVVGLWLMTSSLWENYRMKKVMIYIMAAGMLWISWRLVSLSDFFSEMGDWPSDVFMAMNVVFLVSMLFYGFVYRLRDLRSVMKVGTSWAIVCLIADMVYVIAVLLVAALWLLDIRFMSLLSAAGVYAALCFRIMTDSVFVFWRRQETLIVESMKVTSVTTAVDESRIDDIYKDLYERVLAYFEAEKPYLDGELTINDLVKRLYSNKLYISRAISQFTGRNFCQFVNYYRVIHSIECFRNNPDHKIHELASMSGFNSIVSYNMAFRLFMGENPSEWCRKEKSRMIKKKK